MMVTTLPAGIRAVTEFDGARSAPQPQDRLRAVRKAAEVFRERFLAEPEVSFYASFDLVRVPYPAWYAYTGVYAQSAFTFPLLHIINRLFVIQYRDFDGVTRTLLFSPSDLVGNRETPFFKRMSTNMPSALESVVAPIFRNVEDALRELGIRADAVDYVSFDHLHTQELRGWLGTVTRRAVFPKAKLLVTSQEWQSVRALLPVQADWYCPSGAAGISPDKIIAFDGSVQLGPGLALLQTPGHTEGNHSLAARVPDGIRVTSENGVSADAYEPKNSRVNAIKRYAKATGVEVILNGNTLEGSNDQYISMVMEKTVAGRSVDPDYPNCACSSEATPYWLFPGHPVSYLMGEARFGSLAR